MTQNSQGESTAGKSKRKAARIHWGGTLNNWETHQPGLPDLALKLFQEGIVKRYYIQEEIGEEEETPHLHFYFELNKKGRLIEDKAFVKQIHWENLSRKNAWLKYCRKLKTRSDDERIWYKRIPRPVEKVYWEHLKDHHKAFLEPLIQQVQHNNIPRREINWISDETGNWGKTLMSKYLVDNYNTLIVDNKKADMLYLLAQYMEAEDGCGPDFVVVDLPRSVEDSFLSYAGLEKLKDGLAVSSKYKCEMLRFNSPVVIVMSNHDPCLDKFSDDRLKITRI